MKPLLLDHDGGVDDFLATALCLTMSDYDVRGIVVTPADCYARPAVSATRKLLDLMGRADVSVAESEVRGVNPFPALYRRDSVIIDHLPILNTNDVIAARHAIESGVRFLRDRLRESLEPVTLLVTGPLSTVAAVLTVEPRLEEKIERLVWMGGALEVPGNVEKGLIADQDGTAEWNVFWDPAAAAQVFRTAIPLTMCPLDLTNRMPVRASFIKRLTQQRQHPVSDLLGILCALVTVQDCYFWDVLAAAYLGRPDLYRVEERRVSIVVGGQSEGRTMLDPAGRNVAVLVDADLAHVEDYFLRQWAR